jgi:hypothetical protein
MYVCMYVLADRKDTDVDLLVGGNSNLGIETNMSSNVGGVGAGQHTLHVWI